MVKIQRHSSPNSIGKKVLFLILILVFAAIVLFNYQVKDNFPTSLSGSLSLESGFSSVSKLDYNVGEICKNMVPIRPSGAFFLDAKCQSVPSLEGISPKFNIGTYMGPKVSYHMGTDKVNFRLIKEILEGEEKGGLTFDIGANQGFYTFFLASLGMDVHAFEILESNFKALQHGTEFNPIDVSKHVNLYPIGLGKKNARFSMKGGNSYLGFLKEGSSGPILGVTFDCFAHQSQLDISHVPFVKIDVEGFEIAVLQGAQNSLFKYSKIKVMLMEIGPDRWNRANINLSTGIEELVKASTHFKKSYVLIRTEGSFVKSCPLSLVKNTLSDKKPRVIDGIHMFEIKEKEWKPLMAKMDRTHGDCNFLFSNK